MLIINNLRTGEKSMSTKTLNSTFDEQKEDSKESINQILQGKVKGKKFYKLLLIAFLAIAMSLFHMYTSGFGVFEAWQQRSFTLSFILLLIPLVYPFKSKSKVLRVIIDSVYFLGSL